MLSHYYNRKGSLQSNRDVPDQKENEIINSFYEERRSRSYNAKQHNLLKKNISYFHQQDQIEQTSELTHLPHRPHPQRLLASLEHSLPISEHMNGNSPLNGQHTSPKISINRQSEQVREDDYKQRLKSQLNKRISITSYLTEINQANKQNTSNLNSGKEQERQSVKNRTEERNIRNYPQQQTPHSRVSLNQIINDNCRLRKVVDSHFLNKFQPSQNAFEFSKNEATERTQLAPTQTVNSEHNSHQSESRHNSNHSRQQINQQQNVLMGSQLVSLNENSHPLRQFGQNTTKIGKFQGSYFDPELQSNYKRRISDLQSQLQELTSEKQRQDKLISSIFKMRRVLLQTESDCSLKQLWRWIKHLPPQ